MTTAFLFASLFAFLVLGMPIAIGLGLSSLLTILLFANDSLASLVLKLFQTSEQFTLPAIPFFVLAGSLMTTGGVARRMIDFAVACIGHFRGGLAMASVLACMLFAAVSGSSPATVVAVGSIVIGGMTRIGYSRDFAAGVICNAGTLGILIPPSTVKKLPRQPRAGWAERLRTGREALWGLLLIVIILGGIYGGIFTPTEAAAVSAVYAFLVAVLVYRDLRLADVGRVLADSARVTVMLLFIISNAMLFAHVLTTEQIPQAIAQEILGAGLAPWQFLIVVNLLLLVAGNFMEPSAIILILAPILFPIAIELGVDPIHLGVIMVVNMEIGMVTPPVGLNLFVTSGITGMGVLQVVRAAWPWLMVLLAFLVIVTYVPWLSLILPNALFGNAIVQ